MDKLQTLALQPFMHRVVITFIYLSLAAFYIQTILLKPSKILFFVNSIYNETF